MATHDPDWRPDDSRVSAKDKMRGFSGYRCGVCGRQIVVPPNGMPSLSKHS